MFKTSRTTWLKTKDGVIKISPQGGRKFGIKAPASVTICGRDGKPRRPDSQKST